MTFTKDNGNLVAAGDRNGNVTLLSLNDALTEVRTLNSLHFLTFFSFKKTRSHSATSFSSEKLDEKKYSKLEIVNFD